MDEVGGRIVVAATRHDIRSKAWMARESESKPPKGGATAAGALGAARETVMGIRAALVCVRAKSLRARGQTPGVPD